MYDTTIPPHAIYYPKQFYSLNSHQQTRIIHRLSDQNVKHYFLTLTPLTSPSLEPLSSPYTNITISLIVYFCTFCIVYTPLSLWQLGVRILCSKIRELCYALMLILFPYYAPQNRSLCSISRPLCSHYSFKNTCNSDKISRKNTNKRKCRYYLVTLVVLKHQ